VLIIKVFDKNKVYRLFDTERKTYLKSKTGKVVYFSKKYPRFLGYILKERRKDEVVNQ
jgi:hypothetical protein